MFQIQHTLQECIRGLESLSVCLSVFHAKESCCVKDHFMEQILCKEGTVPLPFWKQNNVYRCVFLPSQTLCEWGKTSAPGQNLLWCWGGNNCLMRPLASVQRNASRFYFFPFFSQGLNNVVWLVTFQVQWAGQGESCERQTDSYTYKGRQSCFPCGEGQFDWLIDRLIVQWFLLFSSFVGGGAGLVGGVGKTSHFFQYLLFTIFVDIHCVLSYQ